MGIYRVGILGATGLVGTTYLNLLKNHPLFSVSFLAASKESIGKRFEAFPHLEVHAIDDIKTARSCCDFVFSAVNTETAKTYETLYAAAGLPVISNTASHRMDPDVPLLIPEINPEHLEILPFQKQNRGWDRGFIVTKPNCSLQSYLIPLFPLHRKFKIKKLMITTMQALSGAGYPGISSLDIIDNIIPFIGGEEEKSEQEPLKILGIIEKGHISLAQDLSISAHCNRVPVMDGHTACISVQFEHKPTQEEILKMWREWTPLPQQLNLPSAPQRLIVYREEQDRPQPRLDRNTESGMAVTVGRLRSCPIFDFRFVALSHNALRGAAMGGLLNAELIQSLGYFDHHG